MPVWLGGGGGGGGSGGGYLCLLVSQLDYFSSNTNINMNYYVRDLQQKRILVNMQLIIRKEGKYFI